MQIRLWSLGKEHDNYVKTGVQEFTKRINNYFKCSWELIPNAKDAAVLSAAELKKKEAAMILNRLQKDDFLITLDERGRLFSSLELADFIQARANASVKTLVFLIGGAYGLDDAVLQRSNLVWSLSKLVFPHQLVRLILAEQVYRSCTILKNEKYHHT